MSSIYSGVVPAMIVLIISLHLSQDKLAELIDGISTPPVQQDYIDPMMRTVIDPAMQSALDYASSHAFHCSSTCGTVSGNWTIYNPTMNSTTFNFARSSLCFESGHYYFGNDPTFNGFDITGNNKAIIGCPGTVFFISPSVGINVTLVQPNMGNSTSTLRAINFHCGSNVTVDGIAFDGTNGLLTLVSACQWIGKIGSNFIVSNVVMQNLIYSPNPTFVTPPIYINTYTGVIVINSTFQNLFTTPGNVYWFPVVSATDSNAVYLANNQFLNVNGVALYPQTDNLVTIYNGIYVLNNTVTSESGNLVALGLRLLLNHTYVQNNVFINSSAWGLVFNNAPCQLPAFVANTMVGYTVISNNSWVNAAPLEIEANWLWMLNNTFANSSVRQQFSVGCSSDIQLYNNSFFNIGGPFSVDGQNPYGGGYPNSAICCHQLNLNGFGPNNINIGNNSYKSVGTIPDGVHAGDVNNGFDWDICWVTSGPLPARCGLPLSGNPPTNLQLGYYFGSILTFTATDAVSFMIQINNITQFNVLTNYQVENSVFNLSGGLPYTAHITALNPSGYLAGDIVFTSASSSTIAHPTERYFLPIINTPKKVAGIPAVPKKV